MSLSKELHETRERQGALEEMVNGLLEVLKRQQQISPTSVQRPSSSQTNQTSVSQVMQRRTSMQQATPNRRLERHNSMYSLSSSQEIEPFITTEASANPMRSSPPPSQPSSSEASSQKSPVSTNFFQASAVFSTPSAPSNQYIPATPVSQPSSQQAPQPSPSLHRSKSSVMSALPSPNVTPSPVYTYNSPAQYSRSFSQTMQTPKQQSQQQEMHTLYRHPSTYSLHQQHQQPAEPPATYQSAITPMPATPTRPSSQTYSTPTPIFQHTPFRQTFGTQQQDPHTQQHQLSSPASFQNIGGIFAQKQRRANNQDDNEDMDLGA